MSVANTFMGTAAESLFDRWISAAEGVSAAPRPDVFGWDRLVQLPDPDGGPPFEFYVQLKSTRDIDNDALRLKLSTALHLIPLQLPVLFVVLACEDATFDQIDSAWVLPLDQRRIEKLLGSRHRADTDRRSYTEFYVYEKLTDVDGLVAPFRHNAIERMRSLIRSRIALSGDAKADAAEKAGYTSHPIRIGFDYINLRELALASLGLEGHIHAKISSLGKTRFDIEEPIEALARYTQSPIFLSLGQTPPTVRFGVGRETQEATIEALYYDTFSVFGRHDQSGLSGFRIRSRFLDLIITDIPDQHSGFLEPPQEAWTTQVVAGELQSFCSAADVIEQSVSEGRQSITLYLNDQPNWTLPLVAFSASKGPVFGPDIESMRAGARALPNLLAAFGASPAHLLCALDVSSQSSYITMMSTVLSPRPPIDIQFASDGDEAAIWVVPHFIVVRLGSTAFGLVFTVIGRPLRLDPDDEQLPAGYFRYRIKNPRVIVEEKLSTQFPDPHWKSDVRKALIALRDRYADREDEVFIELPEFLDSIESE